MATVTLEKLAKVYPGGKDADVRAVNSVDLTINDREFMVLVGPSGCGKSTILRMIAGLEDISEGTVSIDGKVVNDVLPKNRDIAMVFQNYALYPHMTVFDNMAFGLKLRKFPKDEINKRVNEAAAILGIGALLHRKPKALSGGQRQRVAVGRAIVRHPKVFLLDEPLSNLDAKMRVSMRTEISKLHARLAATMIYVTHDQTEAMTMGDRITVMKDANIMQVAKPLELYNHPENVFVASFIGSPPMNLFKGTLKREGNNVLFVEDNSSETRLVVHLDDNLARKGASHINKPVTFGIRPEDINDTLTVASPDPRYTVDARVEISEPMGSETYLYLDSGANSFIARVRSTDRFEINSRIKVTFAMERAHLFDVETENVLK